MVPFPGTAVGSPITIDLSQNPFIGGGDGDGSITISKTNQVITHSDYDITVVLPFAVSQQVPTGIVFFGNEIMATVTITGTMKATGSCRAYFSPYLQWTDENNIPGAGFATSSLGNIPNGILWALGFDNSNAPTQLLAPMSSNYAINLPSGGTLRPAEILYSLNLSDWNSIDGTRVSSGSSTIPAGSTGTITITPNGTSEFYRIRVQE